MTLDFQNFIKIIHNLLFSLLSLKINSKKLIEYDFHKVLKNSL